MDADPTALDRADGAAGLGLVPGPPDSFCGAATVVDLVADGDVVVGAVEVVNDEGALFVTFRTNGDAPLLKTAVAVVHDPTEIPTAGRGNPQPGRFPYKANHRNGPTSVTWQLDVPVIPGEVLHVAAFAEVLLNGEEEGAWGDGEQINASSGWATQFTHTVQSCDGTFIQTVPTTGGTILTAGLELVVPDGSLDEATTFSIAPTTFDDPDVPIVAGTAWEIEPSGTTFDPPALLTLAYGPENLPPDFPEGSLKCFVVSGGVRELIQPNSIDQVNHLITCPLSHLSVVGVAAPGGDPIAEAIAVTDVVTVRVRSPARPDVAEAIGVTDEVTVDVRSPARPDIAEAVGVTDDVTVNVRSPARPDIAEAVGVTDDVTVDVRSPARPDVAEAIGVTDDVTVDVRSPTRPDIAEAIGVADDVTVDVRSPARPDVAEAIRVADEVTVTVEPASAGSFAYIALQGADSVAVVDRATNTLLPKIPVGSFPFAVAVRPGGSEVYVTNRGDGSVSVIDIATQSVVATIANVANDPIDLAFGPDGSTAYVVDNDASLVGVIDATTRTVTTPLQGSTRLSRAIAVTASGATAYVAGVDSLVVFDLLAGAAADTIAGTFTTGDIALTPDDAELWLTDGANDDVLVFDAVAGALAATVTAIPPSPQGIRIDQAGATAYVAHAASGLTPINIAARTPDAAIDLSFDPEWLAVSGDGALAYVSEGRQGSLLAVVNLASRSIIATLTVGPSPAKIGLTP